MKKLLGILVLGLFLITPSQADDIRDFQIEGMSIGDSALDYYEKEKINSLNKNYYKSTFFDKQEFLKSSELIMNCDVSATRFYCRIYL